MVLPYETYGTYWIIKPFLYSSPYFGMAALATIVGIAMAYFEFKRRKLPTKHLIWSSVLIYIFMGIFARLFYFIGPWSWKEYPTWSSRIWGMFSFHAGMVFYGGLIGAIIAIIIYTRIWKINIWDYLDAFAPSAGIILFFARIGCFFSGCCYGIAKTALPWIVEKNGILMHPTQLYESFFALVLFVILTEIRYKQNIKHLFKGYVALWCLVLYSIIRFILEFWRYYDIRFYGLSMSQLISLAIFLVSSAILLYKYKSTQKSFKRA